MGRCRSPPKIKYMMPLRPFWGKGKRSRRRLLRQIRVRKLLLMKHRLQRKKNQIINRCTSLTVFKL